MPDYEKPRYDMVLITTVEADSFAEAENWLVDYADGLADTDHGVFTAVGHTNDVVDDYGPNHGKRIIYLHPENETSQYTGPMNFGPDSEEV